jgi:hypothetical protein
MAFSLATLEAQMSTASLNLPDSVERGPHSTKALRVKFNSVKRAAESTSYRGFDVAKLDINKTSEQISEQISEQLKIWKNDVGAFFKTAASPSDTLPEDERGWAGWLHHSYIHTRVLNKGQAVGNAQLNAYRLCYFHLGTVLSQTDHLNILKPNLEKSGIKDKDFIKELSSIEGEGERLHHLCRSLRCNGISFFLPESFHS